MSKFDEREKGFEKKFVRDEELQFKVNAKRNKYLGEWAAEKLGKSRTVIKRLIFKKLLNLILLNQEMKMCLGKFKVILKRHR